MVVKSERGADGSSGRFRWTSKPVHATKKMVHSSLAVVKEHRRAYLVLNLLYYGLIVAAMVYAAFNPDLQRTLWTEVGRDFSTGPSEELVGAYSGGQVLLTAGLTFAVNLLGGSFAFITLAPPQGGGHRRRFLVPALRVEPGSPREIFSPKLSSSLGPRMRPVFASARLPCRASLPPRRLEGIGAFRMGTLAQSGGQI